MYESDFDPDGDQDIFDDALSLWFLNKDDDADKSDSASSDDKDE